MTVSLAKFVSWETFMKYAERKAPDAAHFLGSIILALVIYYVAGKIIKKLCRFIQISMQKANADMGVTQFITSLTKAGLYAILIFSIAVNFGVEKSSIAALLASGGVAVGLALQGGLSNLAGGVIILLLKPFTVGDYIIENSGKQEGTVVKIDLFYTTLSTVDNKRITVPNGSLTNSSIINVTAQDLRNLEIKVMISYQADLKKAKGIVEKLLYSDPCVISEKDMRVFVDELADNGVIIGLRAWVKTEDYWTTKWGLNEKIKLTFDNEKIEIPYPQLDVHIKTES